MKRTLSFVIALALTAGALCGQTKKLTAYPDLMAQMKKLDAGSAKVSLETIGRSVQGRDIPALFFSSGAFAGQRSKKPLALIFCQQHGDEASGKEAALLLAAELLGKGKKILEGLDLILVPTANPDGSELRQRRNANNRDLNRNHVLLSEPETLALHRLFQRWFPEIVLDVHEFGAVSPWWVGQGLIKNVDEMLGSLSNLNTDPAIRAFSQEVIYPAVRERVEKDGYILFPYMVGSPDEHDRLRFSTNDIDDGRQSLGIYGTLAFILEGKRYGTVDNMLERRSATQLSAMTAFLLVAAARGNEIIDLVRAARAGLLQEVAAGERAFVRMDYFPDPARPSIAFPVFNLAEWKAETREWKNFAPLVKIKKSVRLPRAYVIPAAETALIELLQRHQMRLFRLTASAEATVERYQVLHVAARIEEETSKPELDLEKTSERTVLQAGDVVVFLNQPARRLIPLLLEPESSWGILTDTGEVPSAFGAYMREGGVYPVMRLMDKIELPLEEIR
jgi:hypothetical protein